MEPEDHERASHGRDILHFHNCQVQSCSANTTNPMHKDIELNKIFIMNVILFDTL